MPEKIYNIVMQTPIGKKTGSMSVLTQQGKISGSLELLNHSEPFHGSIDRDGNCQFTGQIVTLMHTIDYIASGQIGPNSLRLFLQGGKNSFQIVGIAQPAEKEQQR